MGFASDMNADQAYVNGIGRFDIKGRESGRDDVKHNNPRVMPMMVFETN